MLSMLSIGFVEHPPCDAHATCGGFGQWCDDEHKCRSCRKWDPSDFTSSVDGLAPPTCRERQVSAPTSGCSDGGCTCGTLSRTLARLDARLRAVGVDFQGADGEHEEGQVEGSSTLEEATHLCERVAAAAAARPPSDTRRFRVCQTGFNRGRSAAAFLSATPSVHLTSFDLGEHSYVEVAEEWIRASFGHRRHALVVGDSRRTLPRAVTSGTLGRCDFVFVDGNHLFDGAIDDIKHFGWASALGTPVLVDDCPSMMGTAFRSACDHHMLECSSHGRGVAWAGQKGKQICEGASAAAARNRSSHRRVPGGEGGSGGGAMDEAAAERLHARAQAIVASEATRRGEGFCDQTWSFSDCDGGLLGSWALRPRAWASDARHAQLECVRACLGCARCAAVSVSLPRRECSWFARCPWDQLQTLPEYPAANGHTFVSVEVRPSAG